MPQPQQAIAATDGRESESRVLLGFHELRGEFVAVLFGRARTAARGASFRPQVSARRGPAATRLLGTRKQQPEPARTGGVGLPLPDKGGRRIRDEDLARIGENQQSTAGRVAGPRRLPLRLRDQPHRRHSTTLLIWTSWASALSTGAGACSA